jgi:hypothetical protein
MSLVKLPYELVSYVVENLDLEDVRSLSLVCRRFQFLMQEASIAKVILEVRTLRRSDRVLEGWSVTSLLPKATIS